MKALLASLSAFFILLPLNGGDVTGDISLIDGSKIKGRVVSATASEVTVMSDLGVLRIALDKLTPESRAKVMEGAKPEVDALLKRIAELEAKVSQLAQENETLRRQALAGSTAVPRPSGGLGITPQTTTPTAGVSYTISSTGKRHRSGCRYFGTGRACGPTDGIACKICGG